MKRRKSNKTSGKRKNRKLEAKQLRAADRQVLGGGYHRSQTSGKWGHRAEQPAMIEE